MRAHECLSRFELATETIKNSTDEAAIKFWNASSGGQKDNSVYPAR
jgi:hypothetical protein